MLGMLFFTLGLFLGSFATALVYRVPRKIDWVARRSACVSCGHGLGVFDLIPVLSWCFAGAKCRYCRQPIAALYPTIEILSGLSFFLIYLMKGQTPEAYFLMAAVPLLISLAVIDLQSMLLPNTLVFALLVLGVGQVVYFYLLGDYDLELLVKPLFSACSYALLSLFLGLILTKVLKKEALGFGDVKFFFVAGLWLGLPLLPAFMILSGVLGVLSSVVWRYLSGSAVFPFGPALILSFFILVLLQNFVF